MKLIFSLVVLVLSLTLLLFQSTSFSTAKVRNNTTLSIVSEENALLAVNYGEDKVFTVTNNTEKKIWIKKIVIADDSNHGISYAGDSIIPSGEKDFSITGDPKGLGGKKIHILASWNGGSAEIKSTIPESFDKEEPEEEESDEEEIEIEIELDANEEQQVPQLNEVQESLPQTNEEPKTSETKEEPKTLEINEEQVTPEVVEEKPAPKVDEKKQEVEIEQEQPSTELEDEQ